MRVGVVFGGRSAEHAVSVASARTVASALEQAGFEVVPLGIAPDGCWLASEAGGIALEGAVDVLEPVGGPIAPTLRHLIEAEVDVIFPIVHGTWGEDGALQGLCEMLDLPYVGAGVTASAVCMDKVLAKEVWRASGIPVVDWETVSRKQLRDKPSVLARLERLELPVFVKPSVGGSSVGVTRAGRAADLAPALEHALSFDDRCLVEVGVDGRELECAVLGYPELEASGVGEIVPGKEFYDYADKYLDDGAGLHHRADLPAGLEEEIRRRAVDAFAAVGGSGMARVDFLLERSGDGLYVNEINTLPGFTAISRYPKLWEVAGLEPPRLVQRLVEAAVARHRDRRRLDRGIKSWIEGVTPQR